MLLHSYKVLFYNAVPYLFINSALGLHTHLFVCLTLFFIMLNSDYFGSSGKKWNVYGLGLSGVERVL